MSALPAIWFMEAAALDAWLQQASERMRLGSSLFMDWDPNRRRPYELLDGGIAVIPISGALSKAGRWWSLGGSYKAIADQVRQALDDASVRSILLDVDSPGGDASGVQELSTVIAGADAVKPVYAWGDGQCCSAAYWLPSCARLFAVNPTTEVGSIGVVGIHMELSQAAESAGYKFTVIRSGREKAYGNSYEPLSPAALASIQGRFDGFYDLFVQAVAANRGLDVSKAGTWAEGKVFLARDALELGLIDRIQNRDDFIASIREETMDKQTLQAKHPDLYAAVKEEGRQEGASAAAPDLDAARAEGAKAGRAEVVALAKAFGGEELAAKMEKALAAGLTGDALAQAAALMGVDTAQKPDASEGDRILQTLNSLDPGGVAAGQAKPNGQGKANANFLVDYVNQRFGGNK